MIEGVEKDLFHAIIITTGLYRWRMMVKGKDTREKILEKAAELFCRQGYSATGLSQILEESGTPKGSLYYYFPNGKEELAREAILYVGSKLEPIIREYLGDGKDSVTVFQNFFLKAAEETRTKKDILTNNVIMFAMEMSDSSEVLREAFASIYEQSTGIFIEKLRECGYSEKEAEERGRLVQVLMDGAIARYLSSKSDTDIFEVISRYIPKIMGRDGS